MTRAIFDFVDNRACRNAVWHVVRRKCFITLGVFMVVIAFALFMPFYLAVALIAVCAFVAIVMLEETLYQAIRTWRNNEFKAQYLQSYPFRF